MIADVPDDKGDPMVGMGGGAWVCKTEAANIPVCRLFNNLV